MTDNAVLIIVLFMPNSGTFGWRFQEVHQEERSMGGMRGVPMHKYRVPYGGSCRILYDNAAHGPSLAKRTRNAVGPAILQMQRCTRTRDCRGVDGVYCPDEAKAPRTGLADREEGSGCLRAASNGAQGWQAEATAYAGSPCWSKAVPGQSTPGIRRRRGYCASGISAEEKYKQLKDGTAARYIYYGCSRARDRNCKNKYIREEELIQQLIGILDQVNINELGMRYKLEEEIKRFHKFQHVVLKDNTKKILDDEEVNIRIYAKYLLKEGSTIEKRELLGNLRSRLVYKDKQVTLLQE